MSLKNKYAKGVRYERQIVNNAREKGKIAFRSAGSHSPIDVCIIDKESKRIQFIQAKATKASQKALEKEFNSYSDEWLVIFEVWEK